MRWAAFLVAALIWAAPARAQIAPAHQALEPYALYQIDISALSEAPLESAIELDAALARAANHDPAAVARGWIAYGALTAAQSPTWVNGVRSRIRAAGRPAVLRQLRRDLTYARRRPPGSAEATTVILRALNADVARMQSAAARYRSWAGAIDTRAWARTDIATRDQDLRTSARTTRTLAPELIIRLHVAPLGAAPLTDARAFGGALFWDDLAGRAAIAAPAQSLRPTHQATLDRMLTLGALIIADALQSEAARADAMMTDDILRSCLNMEQLQFRQCASVTHDASEDAHCLAQHALAAPSLCFSLAEPA